ncbi:hypothetical protein AALA90_16225 [Lachnospiraceae bacterium 38-10]
MGKFQNLGSIVHEMEYDALNGEIKRTMRRSARDMIQLGYLLKAMMDKMVWKAYYNCFDEYLETELQMDYTTATRFIRANEKYSIPGNGMEIEEKYREYSQSVLTEMLNMPQELMLMSSGRYGSRQKRPAKGTTDTGSPMGRVLS